MVEHAPGTSDSDILVLAHSEARTILTFDRDFGELVFHAGRGTAGVVLFRFDPQPPDTLLDCFRAVWPKIEAAVAHHFVVATMKKIRIRPLPS